MEAWSTKDNLAKNCGRGNAGVPFRGWRVTDRAGGDSLLPCTPASMIGSDDDDVLAT